MFSASSALPKTPAASYASWPTAYFVLWYSLNPIEREPMPLIPGSSHTQDKFGHGHAAKHAVPAPLHQHDKSGEHNATAAHGGHHQGHKAAVARMNPEHLHRLVQEAHAGKYGPEAQQCAGQCMAAPQAGAMPEEQAAPMEPAAPPRGAMFAGGSEPDQDDMEPPPNRAAMFAGSRGGM
jgi:hypothetical protein